MNELDQIESNIDNMMIWNIYLVYMVLNFYWFCYK